MNDRTGQVWFVGSDENWQVFLVLDKAITMYGCYEHSRLILSSSWETRAEKVAPYPENGDFAWEKCRGFERIL